METTHKVKVEDRTKIKSITFKHPELMGKDAEKMVKSEYRELLNLKEKLYAAREEVRKLETLYGTLEADWNSKKDMFDIEFESTEKEVKTEKSNMLLNGKLVYKYDY
jgi:glycerol-3-phosphate dehydrogenase